MNLTKKEYDLFLKIWADNVSTPECKMSGEHVKMLRDELGLTQPELANDLCITGRTVQRMEASDEVKGINKAAVFYYGKTRL